MHGKSGRRLWSFCGRTAVANGDEKNQNQESLPNCAHQTDCREAPAVNPAFVYLLFTLLYFQLMSRELGGAQDGKREQLESEKRAEVNTSQRLSVLS